MATPIKMPKLGMTMSEGTVIEWPVALGGFVDKGVVVLRIESEKAEIEIEATASGFMRHVYVEADETVPCGTLLAALTESADAPFDAETFRREHDAPEVPVAVAPAVPSPPAAVTPAGRRAGRKAVAPAARALAKKLGVDPEVIPGTGSGGRVTRADVEAWAAARETLIEVADGVRLEVPTSGAGDEVLLLPGFGTDASVFALQSAILATRFRVRAVNPRGVGLSDAPEQDAYDPVLQAADAAALLDGAVHVVGASMGAAVAIELALGHPERVRSLTLITPVLDVTPRLAAVLDAWCRLAAESSPETLATALLPWMFSDETLADTRTRDRLRRGFAATVARVPPVVLGRYATGLRRWSGTRTDDLARLAAPTLVLTGGADLLATDGPRIAAGVPGARAQVVPGAGHALTLEAADAVRDAILSHVEASACP